MSMFDIKKIDSLFHLEPSPNPRFGEIRGSRPLPNFSEEPKIEASRPLPDFSKGPLGPGNLPNFSLMPFNPETDPINPFKGMGAAKSMEELEMRQREILRRASIARRHMNNEIMSEFSRYAVDAMDKAIKETF